MANCSAASDPFDFELFVRWCVHRIGRGDDYARFAAELAGAVDFIFPPPASGNLREDPDLRRRLALSMARAVWRQTPHPARNYAQGRLPDPGRNEPCYCGSLRKFKHCCEPVQRGMPIERINLLPYLLDTLPKARWRELAGSTIDVDMVAHAAHQWEVDRRERDAQALLEPWFVDGRHFDARHEALFDHLLNVYSTLGRPRKKADLLDRALAHGDRTLRSAAMQRRVSMLADEGKYDAAWALFVVAQRADPESPSLSHLETTLLLSQGREAEGRERARYWLVRFERRRDPALSDLIGVLRSIADEGGSAMLRVVGQSRPQVATFLELWANAPSVQLCYRLTPDGESTGPLQPSPELAQVLTNWQEAITPSKDMEAAADSEFDPWDTAATWLPLLTKHPVLWSAFEVLEFLLDAVAALQTPGTDLLRVGVLQRGENLLRAALKSNGCADLKLEWSWLENRPALRLIGRRLAAEMDAAPSEDHVARLEWLLTLNPNDNQGIREVLLRRYLELGRVDDAVAFSRRYPDDWAAMRYSGALALFANGQETLATNALSAAVARFPKPLTWLLKANPKPPRQDPMGIRVGGDEEAWLYRRDHLALWQRLNALPWARAVKAASKR